MHFLVFIKKINVTKMPKNKYKTTNTHFDF